MELMAMTERGVNPVGRPHKRGELMDVQHPVKMPESLMERLRVRKLATGVPISTQIRRAIESELDGESSSEFPPVRVLGYIPGGPAIEICPLPDHTTTHPPFKLNADCYALIVTGDSMEAEYGLSIPNGSYAFFCPAAVPSYGAIVHAEFEDGERTCTLKKYCPQADGSVNFEPLNKKHKTIKKQEGEYEIKGVFVRAWSG